jgi:hypothetical protein
MMPDYVNELKQARAKLVESRRAQVPGLATPGQWSSFNEIQHTIEQIDKAIAEEQKFAPHKPVSGFGSKDDGYTPAQLGQGYID